MSRNAKWPSYVKLIIRLTGLYYIRIVGHSIGEFLRFSKPKTKAQCEAKLLHHFLITLNLKRYQDEIFKRVSFWRKKINREVLTKNDNYFIFKHTYFYEKAFSFFFKIINQNFASVERFLNIRLFLRSCIS